MADGQIYKWHTAATLAAHNRAQPCVSLKYFLLKKDVWYQSMQRWWEERFLFFFKASLSAWAMRLKPEHALCLFRHGSVGLLSPLAFVLKWAQICWGKKKKKKKERWGFEPLCSNENSIPGNIRLKGPLCGSSAECSQQNSPLLINSKKIRQRGWTTFSEWFSLSGTNLRILGPFFIDRALIMQAVHANPSLIRKQHYIVATTPLQQDTTWATGLTGLTRPPWPPPCSDKGRTGDGDGAAPTQETT